MREKKVIGLAGMPGSGKSILREVALNEGYATLIMGDVVRREAERRGLKPNRENLRALMIDLRKKHGPGVIAERCLEEIRKIKEPVVIVDGLRSLREVEVFRGVYPNFKLIAVHSSPKTRFERLKMRNRRDDPKSWSQFSERDHLEMDIGIGDVIALSDYMIVNEGKREELRVKAYEVLQEVLKDE